LEELKQKLNEMASEPTPDKVKMSEKISGKLIEAYAEGNYQKVVDVLFDPDLGFDTQKLMNAIQMDFEGINKVAEMDESEAKRYGESKFHFLSTVPDKMSEMSGDERAAKILKSISWMLTLKGPMNEDNSNKRVNYDLGGSTSARDLEHTVVRSRPDLFAALINDPQLGPLIDKNGI